MTRKSGKASPHRAGARVAGSNRGLDLNQRPLGYEGNSSSDANLVVRPAFPVRKVVPLKVRTQQPDKVVGQV
jgi:hypothetical protein